MHRQTPLFAHRNPSEHKRRKLNITPLPTQQRHTQETKFFKEPSFQQHGMVNQYSTFTAPNVPLQSKLLVPQIKQLQTNDDESWGSVLPGRYQSHRG